jgi:hypothetical protein
LRNLQKKSKTNSNANAGYARILISGSFRPVEPSNLKTQLNKVRDYAHFLTVFLLRLFFSFPRANSEKLPFAVTTENGFL